jgi:hypothetical protein
VLVKRAASPWATTVEIQPWELPPPPNAREKVLDALHHAARWAPDLGDDVLGAVQELMRRLDRRNKAA